MFHHPKERLKAYLKLPKLYGALSHLLIMHSALLNPMAPSLSPIVRRAGAGRPASDAGRLGEVLELHHEERLAGLLRNEPRNRDKWEDKNPSLTWCVYVNVQQCSWIDCQASLSCAEMFLKGRAYR